MAYRRAVAGAIAVIALVLGMGQATGSAQEPPRRGQLLYVPVYSEVPFGDRAHTINLTATLSIRNLSRTAAITLTRVDYFHSSGRFVRAYLPAPRSLAPLAAVEYLVQESDRSGGISASFLVQWEADGPEPPPLVEAVMISTVANQGISFATRARVLEAQ
jgi:hypothetical protein